METSEKKKRAPGGGRKVKHPDGPAVPLGVGKVAPDVARLVAEAAEGPTAFVEAACRAYAQHGSAPPKEAQA